MQIFGLDISKHKPRAASNIADRETQDDKRADAVMIKELSWAKMFGSGKPMYMDGAVSRPYEVVAAVYKAIKAICDNVAQLDWKVYSKASGQEVEDKNISRLLESPNPQQSPTDFLQEWVGFYSLYGEGFMFPIQSIGQALGEGIPAEIYVLDPRGMIHTLGKASSAEGGQSGQIITAWRYGTLVLPPEAVIHTKDFNPYNKLRGMSPIKSIADEIQIDQKSLEFNLDFFNNDATPNFIISTEKTLSDEQRKQILAAIENRHQGTGNKHKSQVMWGGLKAEAIGSTHKEMEFIEQKRLMREEIIGTWRVPKSFFGITDDLNYATFMGQMRVFWIYTIMPVAKKFEDSFNKHIVSKYRNDLVFKFDYSNVPAFQADFSDKVTTAKTLFDMGFSGNEINDRLELGFDEADWRKEWWIPMTQVPASMAGELNQPQDEPPPPPADEPPAKAVNKAPKTVGHTMKQMLILRGFLRRQSLLENKLEGKIGKYFIKLRKEVLKTDTVNLAHGVVSIDWQEFDKELTDTTKPILLEAVKQGIDLGKDALGKKTIKDDILDHRINSFLQIRADKITHINLTMKRQIGKAIEKAIQEGATISQEAQSILDLGEKVRESLRQVFNNAGTRAKLIARTETVGAVNGGADLFYKSEGVEKKEWITAHDEFVRESHRQCEAQGAIPTAGTFANGLRYPGDMDNGDAGEVCNCRCALAPVVLE